MKSFLIILISLFFFVLGCKKKNDDPQPSPPQDIIVYQTRFDSKADPLWKTDSISRYQAFYNNANQFQINVDTLSWAAWERSPYTNINYDYSIQVDLAITLTDPNKWGYGGFIYNYVDSSSYCIFRITPNGTFSAYQKKSGTFTTLIYETVSYAIKKGNGSINTLLLIQSDKQLEFIINGISTGIFNFSRPTAVISVGLYGGTEYSPLYTPVSVNFDNFIIRKPI